MSFLDLFKNRAFRFLRWTETYTHTDMRYLAYGGFWLAVGQGVSSISALVLTIVFANVLPQETYGTYRYLISFASILVLFSLPGITTALTRAVAQGYEGSVVPALKTRIAYGTLGSLVALGIAGYYFFIGNNHTLASAFVVIALFVPWYDSFGVLHAYLHGKKKFAKDVLLYVPIPIAAAIALITTAWFTKNVLVLLFVYFFVWSTGRAITLAYALYTMPPNKTSDSSTISYGKHLSVMNVLGTISNYFDNILIFTHIGAAQAAVYAIAIGIPEQIKQPLKYVTTLALPNFSARSPDEVRAALPRKTLLMFLVLVPVVGIYWVAAPYIFALLFPLYSDSVFLSQIYALGILAMPGVLPQTYLTASKQQRKLYIFNTIYPFVQIVSLIVGILTLGILGVVLARLFARIFFFFIVMYLAMI